MRALPFTLVLVVVARFCGPVLAADYALQLADSAQRPVGDAVVALYPLDHAVPPLAEGPPPEAEIVQLNGEFTPLVTAVRTGTRISFPNRDQVQHQVYSLSPAKRFEIPLHGGEKVSGEIFDRAGLVAIGCNIHDWMRAYILILDTPWFALSSPTGAVALTAPAGRYRLEIWHHRLAQVETREITLGDAAPLAEQSVLALRRDRRPPRAIGADAAGYR
jgi:plastocyanin